MGNARFLKALCVVSLSLQTSHGLMAGKRIARNNNAWCGSLWAGKDVSSNGNGRKEVSKNSVPERKNKRSETEFEWKLEEMQEKDRKGAKLSQSYCDSVIGLCVASDAWDKVLEVLDVMSHQNLPQQRSTYRACLRACHLLHNADSALAILDAMTHALIPPHATDYALTILTLCKYNEKHSGAWKKGLGVLRKATQEGERMPLHAYDALMSAMARDARWKEALQLLDSMHQRADVHPAPRLSTYHALLEACLAASQAEKAVQLLLSMPNKNIMPTQQTYNLVISACCKKRQWQRSIQLLQTMEQQNIQPTTFAFNSIINACSKAKEAGAAMHLFHQMKKKGVEPNIITYNSAMSACANTQGRWRDALVLLDECRRAPGVTPDIITYTCAIRACARGRKTKRALSLLEVVRDEGLQLDVFVYTSVIDACAKGKNWRKALDLLDEMRQNGVKPNAFTYSVAIAACGNGGQWERAMELLYQMKEKNMNINVITYNNAISALAKASKAHPSSNTQLWRRALELLTQMKKDGVQPDLVSYSSAINACGSAGRWKEALHLIQTMQKGGPRLRPNKIAYTAALTACGRAGKWEHALRLFNDMKATGLMPDRVAYNALMSAVRIAGQPDKAYDIWREMCGHVSREENLATATADSRHVSPDIITLTDVLAALDRSSSDYRQKSDEIFAEAVQRGIVLRSDSLDSLLEVDLSGMSFPVAKTAIRFILKRIERSGEDVNDLQLITGVGRRGISNLVENDEDIKYPASLTGLREFIREILREDFDPPIYSIVPKNAQGTVVVKKEVLQKWIEAQKSTQTEKAEIGT